MCLNRSLLEASDSSFCLEVLRNAAARGAGQGGLSKGLHGAAQGRGKGGLSYLSHLSSIAKDSFQLLFFLSGLGFVFCLSLSLCFVFCLKMREEKLCGEESGRWSRSADEESEKRRERKWNRGGVGGGIEWKAAGEILTFEGLMRVRCAPPSPTRLTPPGGRLTAADESRSATCTEKIGACEGAETNTQEKGRGERRQEQESDEASECLSENPEFEQEGGGA